MFVCAQYVFPCAPLHTASNVHRLMICVLVVMTAPRFLKEGSRKYQRPIDWKNCESEYMPSYFFLPLSHTHTHTHTSSSPSHSSILTHSTLTSTIHLPHTPRVQPDYVSLSFPTISSSGPNGAIIHYKCVWGRGGREGVCGRRGSGGV